MNPEVIISLLSSLIGGSVVALITHLSMRRKTEAEAKKLEAEAEKIKAETTRLNLEIGLEHTIALRESELPMGWFASYGRDDYLMLLDTNIARSGKASGTIKAKPYARGFDTMVQSFDAAIYKGKRLRLSGWIKVQNVKKMAWMWMRIDSPEKGKNLGFDNMHDRPIKGTLDWRKYEIVLDVPHNATVIIFGFALEGEGQVWGDDFTFEIVDDSIALTDMNLHPRVLPKQPINLSFDV
jgi:hypothetical protein